jgi:hypothetical protein
MSCLDNGYCSRVKVTNHPLFLTSRGEGDDYSGYPWSFEYTPHLRQHVSGSSFSQLYLAFDGDSLASEISV